MASRSPVLQDSATPTYDEYVGARWTTLYRTAYLLTGNHADAEDLTQTALVKAHLSWKKVSSAASPDAYVRRVLTNAFLSGRRPLRVTRERLVDEVPEVTVPDHASDDHLVLWPHVSSLPPRQRAVVVLRYYEDLSEQEIADILGCSTGTVKSTASDALQGTPSAGPTQGRRPVMNVEQTLTDELRVVASDVQAPPPPPAAELVHLAGRERNRTLATRLAATGLVAAAVVAAIVIGAQVGRPSTAPDPAKPSPSYYADGVPYVLEHVLYIDHRAQQGEWIKASTAGDHTIAERADRTLVIFHDGVEVGAVSGGLVLTWDLSDDGTKLSWFSTAGRPSGSLQVRDLSTLTEVGRRPIRLRENQEEGLGLSMHVEDDGTTYYQVNDGQWYRWKPGSTPTKSLEPSGERTEQPGFAGIEAWVRLSPDHLWGAWLTDREGNQLTADQRAGGVTVQKPGDPSSRFTIPLPLGSDVGFVDWQTPSRLFVVGGTSDVDCDIVDRRCEKGYAP